MPKLPRQISALILSGTDGDMNDGKQDISLKCASLNESTKETISVPLFSAATPGTERYPAYCVALASSHFLRRHRQQ